VSSIESLGVEILDLTHPLSKVGIRGFQQIVGITHQAVGVDGPVELLYQCFHDTHAGCAIYIIQINSFLPITTENDVL
jgi:hypothetical protein